MKSIFYSCFLVLVLSAFVYLFSACNPERKNYENDILLEGHIQFPYSDKIYFKSYPDSISTYAGIKLDIDSAVIDKNGNYSFIIHTKKPYAFDLVCGDSILVTNLFLIPGDKLKINFIGKRNKPEVFPVGEEAKFNTFLLMFLDTFYRNPESKRVYYIASNYMDIVQFSEYNDTRKHQQLNYFNNYFGDDKLKKEYSDYALNSINYGIAVDRLMYLWKKRMKIENVHADSSYFNFTDPSFVENSEAFHCPAYIRFLNLYIKDIYERMVEKGELPVDKLVMMKPQVEKYKLAQKLLHKPYCDAVIYNIVQSDMHDISNGNVSSNTIDLSYDSMLVKFNLKYSLK